MTQSSDTIKHSAAHVMAAAIKRLFPSVKIGIGPVTKEGFYYDIDIEKQLNPQDLQQIEITANEIVKENLKFQQVILEKDAAMNMLLQNGQIYKAELVKQIPDPEVSFFKLGEEFTDLCRGPHIPYTQEIGVISTTEVTKTFWKEDPKRPPMQRVHGRVFRSLSEAQEYKKKSEAIKTKNFVEIGQQQQILFQNNNHVYFSNFGVNVVETIHKFLLSHYQITNDVQSMIPLTESSYEFRKVLFEQLSAKNQSYKSFPQHFSFRSTNNIKIKKNQYFASTISYVSFFDETHGMSEFGKQIEELTNLFRKTFHIDIAADILSDNLDDTKVQVFSNILKSNVISHNQVLSKTNNVVEMQLYVIDSYERRWDLATLRVFDKKTPSYVDDNNEQKNLFIVETEITPLKLLAYIFEEGIGELPVVLKPITVICIPIKTTQNEYAEEVAQLTRTLGYFSDVDTRSISMQNKIKHAEEQHIPVILIIGNKEISNKAVSVRFLGKEVGLMDVNALDAFLKENLAIK